MSFDIRCFIVIYCDINGFFSYKINTNLSSRVGHLNPAWNDPEESDDEKLDVSNSEL